MAATITVDPGGTPVTVGGPFPLRSRSGLSLRIDNLTDAVCDGALG